MTAQECEEWRRDPRRTCVDLFEVVENRIGRERQRIVRQQIRAEHDVTPPVEPSFASHHAVVTEREQRVMKRLGHFMEGGGMHIARRRNHGDGEFHRIDRCTRSARP
jgi:hypothetical protein